jgi:ornithine carbamoyltransferase
MKHFVQITDFSVEEIQATLKLTEELKTHRLKTPKILDQESWGLLFYKSSTRTRVSFEVGVQELGANAIVLNSQNTQIGRGETIKDTAKVLSRYLHGLVIRAYDHSVVTEFAEHATMPIVNGLTDFNHPCQILTDIYSILERYSPKEVNLKALEGKKVVFLGDTASNMANSWILAAAYLNFELILAGPSGFEPKNTVLKALKDSNLTARHSFTNDAMAATENADVLYTDVWVSMGDENEAEARKATMKNYQVNEALLKNAHKDALFLHCLPAHLNEEVTQEVIEGAHSIVYDQAENRLHTQKAVMAQLKALR